MIKSIFDDEDTHDQPPPEEKKADHRGANVLGIFGEEKKIGEGHTGTTSGPFDTSGIEMPFPVPGRSGKENAEPDLSDNQNTQEEAYELRKQSPFEKQPPPPLADYTPPTTGETIRMTGLAWSAGIMLFGAIAFLTVIGWFADLLMGTSPWGIVAGIIIGSLIGFVQLFRINAEIIRIAKGKKDPQITGLGSLSVPEEPANVSQNEAPEASSALSDKSPPTD